MASCGEEAMMLISVCLIVGSWCMVAWGLTGVFWKGCRYAPQHFSLSLYFNHLYGMKLLSRQKEWLSEKQCFSPSSSTEKCKRLILKKKWVCAISDLNNKNITSSWNFHEYTNFSVKYLRGKINAPVAHPNISMWIVVLMLAHHQCQKSRTGDRNIKFCFADYLRNLEQLSL